MAVFTKLAIIATAALAAMVSAAPIEPVTRHTTATLISEADQLQIKAQDASSSPFSGRGTWFTDSVGSCGTAFNTNDMIVAMNAGQMDGTSQCGKTVKIQSGGKTVTARVTDTCPAQYCAPGSLDLSQAVFEQLAPLSQGVVSIQWEFV
ncbi:hypothetical protein EDD11_009914 [Mortierella claussenii]|nr:hypothetical protein EDD11_009914 [Mortierella claussenii]